MLKSCSYCGKIHAKNFVCREKKQRDEKRWQKKRETNASIFRCSSTWTRASLRIRARDKHMCLCCKANLPGTVRKYNTKNLSVHHIIPVEEDYSQRLAGENLISVCSVHHEMCESGAIDRSVQRELAAVSMLEAGESADAQLVL